MQKFRILFFQTLLLVLVLAFTLAVRFVQYTESTDVGSFGKEEIHGNVTVAEVFGRISGERVSR